MSIEIPTNMEEVAMKIAQAQVRGTSLTKDEVIKTAVLYLMQSFMDEALEGHYDDVAWRDQTLVVTDFMGEEVGTVAPEGADFNTDFEQNADALIERLEIAAERIVGGR